ncbi:hypothetical protein ASC66_11510 [Leifsonia sp. Root4]|nr:hypothetical protein ASC66_11510 [Leifsonia sp. Root4]
MARIADIVREAATLHLQPSFRALGADPVWEKAPGEVVTIADEACEAALAPRYAAVPGSVVIGEEAVADDPSVLRQLSGEELVWLLDPLDGTRAFVAGSPDYGVMAALLPRGETVLAVMHQPEHGATYVSGRGTGAFHMESGARLSVPSPPREHLLGAGMKRFLPPEVRDAVEENEHRFTTLELRTGAACIEYPSIAAGERDFMLYWRTLTWDHAPGVLLLAEAGGVAAHLDGAAYAPTAQRDGLLVATSDVVWHAAAGSLGL